MYELQCHRIYCFNDVLSIFELLRKKLSEKGWEKLSWEVYHSEVLMWTVNIVYRFLHMQHAISKGKLVKVLNGEFLRVLTNHLNKFDRQSQLQQQNWISKCCIIRRQRRTFCFSDWERGSHSSSWSWYNQRIQFLKQFRRIRKSH